MRKTLTLLCVFLTGCGQPGGHATKSTASRFSSPEETYTIVNAEILKDAPENRGRILVMELDRPLKDATYPYQITIVTKTGKKERWSQLMRLDSVSRATTHEMPYGTQGKKYMFNLFLGMGGNQNVEKRKVFTKEFVAGNIESINIKLGRAQFSFQDQDFYSDDSKLTEATFKDK